MPNSFSGKIKQISPKTNLDLVGRAFEFAKKAHRGQKREGGAPYIIHPTQVALYIANIGLDENSIAAALLHDVVEDTDFSLEDIKREFGAEIAFLVDGVTKLGRIKYQGGKDSQKSSSVERQAETLRKMILAMAEDIRVVLIKLADRFHNMQTLSAVASLKKQKRIALETMDIYAPLAYRLGMQELSGDLRDLAFPILFPKEYRWLIENVKEQYKERKEFIKRLTPLVEKKLKEAGIEPLELHSRAKHYYSLWRKLLRFDMDIEKIYDLVALRIIVKDISDCYATLGIIHKYWPPLPGRIKDYIALPKPNGYQSLHSTVFCEEGKVTEFQIRTPQMHKRAECGIAAHWFYSEKKEQPNFVKKGVSRVPQKELLWVSQLRDWQKEFRDPKEFLDSLKIDFFKDRIFVITPKGEVIDLPEGSTPVDFAYAIHTEVGHQCAGAKVNGKMVSLDTQLNSGDLVEIFTQKNKQPSESWLEFVKTSQAQRKIRSAKRGTTKSLLLPEIQKTAEFKIIVSDRPGLLHDISEVFSRAKVNISDVNARATDYFPSVNIRCQIKDQKIIEKLLLKLKRIPDVKEISYKIK